MSLSRSLRSCLRILVLVDQMKHAAHDFSQLSSIHATRRQGHAEGTFKK